MPYGKDSDHFNLVEGDGRMAGVPVTDRGTWMQLCEGRIFYPLDPRKEEVYLDDIATSLSRQIRFNGLSDHPVSVAQHSVQCAYLAFNAGHGPKFRLHMLMHDAAETYIGDMIRPLKVHFPEFKKIEDRINSVILDAFNIPKLEPYLVHAVKYFDNLAWAWEKRDMFGTSREWPYTPTLPKGLPEMYTWTEKESRSKFINEFSSLKGMIKEQTDFSDWLGEDLWEHQVDSRDWRDI